MVSKFIAELSALDVFRYILLRTITDVILVFLLILYWK